MPASRFKNIPQRKNRTAALTRKQGALRPDLETMTVDEVRELIDTASARGITLRAHCEMMDKNYHTVIMRIHRNPDLSDFDMRARARYLVHAVRSMDDVARNEVDVARARLICDNIKWEAARVCRNIYGDNITVRGDEENPLTVKLVLSADDLVARLKEPEEKDITPES